MRTVRLKSLVGSLKNGAWGDEAVGDEGTYCIRAADFDYVKLRTSLTKAPKRLYPTSVVTDLKLQRGDLVLEKSGGGENQPVGRAVLYDHHDSAVATNFAARLRPSSGVDSRYLNYLLAGLYASGATERCIKQTTGIQNLDTDAWLQTRVLWPTLDRQRQIADFLDDQVALIDEIIRLREEQIEAVRARALRRLHDLLVPTGSRMIQLRRLGTRVTTGPFGTVFSADSYASSGVPMINPSHIKDGRLVPDDHHVIDAETAVLLRRHRLRAGDLVTSRKGDLGRTALVTNAEDGWICGSDSIAIHPDTAKLLPEFLDALLWLPEIREQLMLSSVGATMPSLSEGNLRNLRVPAVPLDRQRALSTIASDVRVQLVAAELQMREQVTALQERKRSLITSAVTGEFDVSTSSLREVV